MKRKLILGLMLSMGLLTVSTPAAAYEIPATIDQALGLAVSINQRGPSVSVAPQLDTDERSINVRVAYVTPPQTKEIRAIEVLINGLSRQVRHIEPSAKGDVDVPIAVSSLSLTERTKPLRIQAKVYTEFAEPKLGDKHTNKPAAISRTVNFELPTSVAQPVSWTPISFMVNGLAGTMQSASVEMRSIEKIDRASFRVSANLSQMVSQGITGEGVIQSNITYSIPLTIAIPGHKPAGVYKGAVELLAAGEVVSKVPVAITVTSATNETIPQTVATPSEDKIVRSNDSTLRLVKDEILVGLDFGLTNPDQRIKEIAAQTQGVFIGSVPDAYTYQLRYRVANLDQLKAKRTHLVTLPGVSFASRNFAATSTSKFPNDSLYETGSWLGAADDSLNWGLKYIKAPAAWDITTGNKSTRIGVIDSAFVPSHEDLRDNVVPASGHLRQVKASDYSASTPHGTHVSGILCASGNNGKGIAGVNWQCSLGLYDHGIDFDNKDPEAQLGFVINTMQSMMYAAQDDMRVVNMSFGWGGESGLCKQGVKNPDKLLAETDDVNDTLRRGILWAERRKKDVLWVFAAGNSCRDVKYISPASLVHEFPTNTMAVAAVKKAGVQEDAQILPESVFGPGVTVAAPGENIYSTAEVINPSWSLTCLATLGLGCKSHYEKLSGTSQVAPYVSGLAGLVLSAHSDYTAEQVKNCIVNAANGYGHTVQGHPFKVISAPEAVECKPPKTEPCEFYSGAPHTCESTNPAVVLKASSSGDSSDCDFSAHVKWGDGKENDYAFPGFVGPAIKTYAAHTYEKPGPYRIDITGQVVSGGFFCSTSDAAYNFTLLPKSSP